MSVMSRDTINLSIGRMSQSTLTQNTTSVSNFVCDDINCNLNVELIALHLALLNQSLKYESLITSSTSNNNVNNNCSSIDSCTADDTLIKRIEHSYIGLPDLLFQTRKAAMELGAAVVSAISLMGAANILLQLAQNDKDLISALLNSSEIELRLLHNMNHSAENTANSQAASSTCSDEIQNSEEIFYTQCKYMHDELQIISFGSISSFLLLLSRCIAFDATLFCDYLCSPETQALKYLLRITKQFMVLDKSPSYADCSLPAAKSHERNNYFLDICVKTLSHSRIKGTGEKSSKAHNVSSMNGSENHVDGLRIITSAIASSYAVDIAGSGNIPVDITASENIPADITGSENIPVDITGSENIPVDITGSENIPVDITGSENIPLSISALGLNSVLSWIASESSTIIDDSPDTLTGEISGDFIDKSLWGICEPGVERVRVSNVKSAICLEQQVCPSEWLRNADERGQKSISSIFPLSMTTGAEIEKSKSPDLSTGDEYKEAVALYDGTLDFLIELRNLLSKLGHSDKSFKSVPFDCSLLVRRLDAIILFL